MRFIYLWYFGYSRTGLLLSELVSDCILGSSPQLSVAFCLSLLGHKQSNLSCRTLFPFRRSTCLHQMASMSMSCLILEQPWASSGPQRAMIKRYQSPPPYFTSHPYLAEFAL